MKSKLKYESVKYESLVTLVRIEPGTQRWDFTTLPAVLMELLSGQVLVILNNLNLDILGDN